MVLWEASADLISLSWFRVFREQKRVAKAIIGSQEEAYWRLQRPPVSAGIHRSLDVYGTKAIDRFPLMLSVRAQVFEFGQLSPK